MLSIILTNGRVQIGRVCGRLTSRRCEGSEGEVRETDT